MPFVLVWKPVLKPLKLSDYHPDFGKEVILVCVNPQKEFIKLRDDLIEQNAIRFAKTIEPPTTTDKAVQVGETRQKVDEFLHWQDEVFHPKTDEWFAKLWSFGDEQYTVDNIRQYEDVDPHFVNWLRVQSVEMIREHSTGKKKN